MKMSFELTGDFLEKAMYWASGFQSFLYTYDNHIDARYGGFSHRLWVGQRQSPLQFDEIGSLNEITTPGFFGHLNYDLKNLFHPLRSENPDFIPFPLSCFSQPEHLLSFSDTQATIETADPKTLFDEIQKTEIPAPSKVLIGLFQHDTSRQEYLEKVKYIQDKILDGAFYELNYCTSYQINEFRADPVQLYQQLCRLSPMPFSCLYKLGDKWAISASPERFLKKQGDKFIAQPIKGTVRRGKNAEEDLQLRNKLQSSEKEMAENVMIVDLMRNDISRISQPGSVQVEELFGLYPFKQIYQMISTITGKVYNHEFGDIIRKTFPMGSMTGAPKREVMKYIEAVENFRRGLYSGSIGTINPEGDFDFNVVIRTLLIDQNLKRASFSVGSAITLDAVAEEEWEECLVKAEPFFRLLHLD